MKKSRRNEANGISELMKAETSINIESWNESVLKILSWEAEAIEENENNLF